jgi:hypothetical protein
MSQRTSFDAAMEWRFQEYVDHLGAVLGNDARRCGLSDYMNGRRWQMDAGRAHRY